MKLLFCGRGVRGLCGWLSWRRALTAELLAAALSALTAAPAVAGPIDLVIDPSPQAAGNTCQSYSLGLALAFNPNSPVQPQTAQELRDLERRLRAELVKSADGKPIVRKDWAAAVSVVTNGRLVVLSKGFQTLDAAMRFVAQTTGIDHADQLPPVLSAALVKTPVLVSFRRIGQSDYPEGHIVTVFGIALPPATIVDGARPKLLLVNSAVKYSGGLKNICAEEDLSDADRYRATAALTADYDPKLFGAPPYLVTYVSAP